MEFIKQIVVPAIEQAVRLIISMIMKLELYLHIFEIITNTRKAQSFEI